MSMRMNRKRVTIALTATLIVFILGMLMIPHSAEAYLWPKNVRGHVWDTDGNIVPNTPITINIRYETDDSIRATYTATTDSAGFYSKSVLASDWDPGNKIQVIATHGVQQSNTTTATTAAVQFVNVTFPFAIPEFGPSWVGLLTAGGAVAAVGVAMLIFWKRK